MVDPGMTLYNNYRKLVLGSVPWEDLPYSSKSVWEAFAELLIEEGWENVV